MLRCPLLCLWLLLLLSACGADEKPVGPNTGAAQPALTVELITPQAQSLAREVAASGSVHARELIELGVELSGVRISKVGVEVGDVVQAGQVLLELDLRSVEAEYQQVNAQVMEAQAMLKVAQTALERGQALRPKGLISASDADQLTANHSQAVARLASARASRDSAALRREFGTLKAPAAGVIAARMVQPGQMAMAGTPLLQLIRDSELEWRGEVAERDLLLVRPGMPVRVKVPDGSEVQGEVRQVAPTLDPQTRLGMIYVRLPDPGNLRAGMFATGQIQTGLVDGLTIPMSALVMRDGHGFVYLVEGERAIERAVVLGAIRNERAEIVSGLQASEQIVGVGAGFLNDGDRVQVVLAGD